MAEQTKSRVSRPQLKKKILVVDDDPDAAELVSDLLEREGHEVRSVHASSDALRIAPQFLPDIAFLDIGLLGMDGFELVVALRALPELDNCRFVAITGYDDADDRKQSARVGFEAHLVKPIALETLQQVLGSDTRPESARRVAG